MKIFLIALLSIGMSVAAQFSLKAGMSSPAVKVLLTQAFTARTVFDILTNKYVFGGFFLYGLGAVVWLSVLSKWDVSKAYPLVGIGFILTLLVGAVAGEQITALRAMGVLLIGAGVWLVATS